MAGVKRKKCQGCDRFRKTCLAYNAKCTLFQLHCIIFFLFQSGLHQPDLQANCLVFISQTCRPIVWSSSARLAGQLSGLHQPDLQANCLVFISQACRPIVWSSIDSILVGMQLLLCMCYSIWSGLFVSRDKCNSHFARPAPTQRHDTEQPAQPLEPDQRLILAMELITSSIPLPTGPASFFRNKTRQYS